MAQQYQPNGNDRAQAALDRSTVLNWKPARGFQLGLALVDAMLAKRENPIADQIARNIQNLR